MFETHEMRVMKVTEDDVVFFGLIKETGTKIRGGESDGVKSGVSE